MPRSHSPESSLSLARLPEETLHTVNYWPATWPGGLGAGAQFTDRTHEGKKLATWTRPLLKLYPHNFKTETDYQRAVQSRKAMDRLDSVFSHGSRYATGHGEVLVDQLSEFLQDDLDADETEMLALNGVREIIRSRAEESIDDKAVRINRFIGQAGMDLWLVGYRENGNEFSRGKGFAAQLDSVTVVDGEERQLIEPVILNNKRKKGLLPQNYGLNIPALHTLRKDR